MVNSFYEPEIKKKDEKLRKKMRLYQIRKQEREISKNQTILYNEYKKRMLNDTIDEIKVF